MSDEIIPSGVHIDKTQSNQNWEVIDPAKSDPNAVQDYLKEKFSPPTELTEEQKKLVDELFSRKKPPIMMDVVRLVFKDDSLTARGVEAKLIKKYLVEVEKKQANDFNHGLPLYEDYILAADEKQFVEERWETMQAVDIARALFPLENPNLNSSKTIAISKYIKEVIHPLILSDKRVTTTSTSTEYRPPRSVPDTLGRLKESIPLDWKANALRSKQEEQLKSLKRYLNSFKFGLRFNSYTKVEDRHLFEDTFVRYTYDKEDLLEEEIDQFISLSAEVVMVEDINRRMQMTKERIDGLINDPDGKVSMSLAETLSVQTKEYNEAKKRVDNAYKALTGARSERLALKIKENASVLNLVQAWRKKESREQLIAIAQKQKKKLEEEVDKLMNMDDVRGLVAGISKNIALNG